MSLTMLTGLKPGDRIELIKMVEDRYPVDPGTQGTVKEVSVLGTWVQVWVDWDNGRRLAMILPDDQYRLVSSTLKRPEEFFTDPRPSTVIEEARRKIEEDELT